MHGELLLLKIRLREPKLSAQSYDQFKLSAIVPILKQKLPLALVINFFSFLIFFFLFFLFYFVCVCVSIYIITYYYNYIITYFHIYVIVVIFYFLFPPKLLTRLLHITLRQAPLSRSLNRSLTHSLTHSLSRATIIIDACVTSHLYA